MARARMESSECHSKLNTDTELPADANFHTTQASISTGVHNVGIGVKMQEFRRTLVGMGCTAHGIGMYVNATPTPEYDSCPGNPYIFVWEER
jgi:hypothetical protein